MLRAVVLSLLALSWTAAEDGIRLSVDGRDLPRGLLRIREELPAQPGHLVLALPGWVPGTRTASDSAANLGGLRLLADDGRTLPWARDPSDINRFQVEVPPGATRVIAELVTVANHAGALGAANDVLGGTSAALINWGTCLLLPEDRSPAELPVTVLFTAPAGWRVASASTSASANGGLWTFAAQPAARLLEHPLLSAAAITSTPVAVDGGWCRVHSADAGGGVADARWSDGLVAVHRQARALFARSAAANNDLLLLGWNDNDGMSLAAHRDGLTAVLPSGVLTNHQLTAIDADLAIARALVAPWCAALRPTAVDCRRPPAGDEPWISEGLPLYLGMLVAVRGGLVAPEHLRDRLAMTLDILSHRAGRGWRCLADDLAHGADHRAGGPWEELQRGGGSEEAALLWCEIDLRLRAAGVADGLDAVARQVAAAPPGSLSSTPAMIAALDALAHQEWGTWLAQRLRQPAQPLPDLAASGWTLGYNASANVLDNVGEDGDEAASGTISAAASLGCSFDGQWIFAIVPGSPADRAGLHDRLWISTVGGTPFTGRNLEKALIAAQGSGTVVIEVGEQGDEPRKVTIDYRGGPRHPHLLRGPGPDLLAAMLGARAGEADRF